MLIKTRLHRIKTHLRGLCWLLSKVSASVCICTSDTTMSRNGRHLSLHNACTLC